MMGIGNGQNTGLLQALGVREVMHGVDLLVHDDPLPGLWARVIGDVLDSALLGIAATRTQRPAGLAGVFAMVLPVVALDVYFAQRLTRDKSRNAPSPRRPQPAAEEEVTELLVCESF
jgi:hypothetical protein